MKKIDILKTIQLIAFAIITLLGLGFCLFNENVRYAIANDEGTRYICIILWLLLVLSYAFLIAEFSFSGRVKKDFSDLDYAATKDPLSGINNRRSADNVLDKYPGEAPAGFAVVMAEIVNIAEINELEGRMAGNQVIREFSAMMSRAASGSCFVARNDGCRFIAIFERANDGDVSRFLARLSELNDEYTRSFTPSIYYRSGNASAKECPGKTAQDVVALASKRMYSSL